MCPFSVRVTYTFVRNFSWKLLHCLPYSPWLSVRFTPSRFGWWICLPSRYLACTSSSSRWLQLPLSVIPSHIYEYRNLYLLSIDYASRPRLRSRLTQSGRTFLWKPWVFGAWDSHPRSATHTGILSSMISTRPLDRASPFMERSPTIPWDP